MEAISPKHHCGIFDGHPTVGGENERAGKPDDEVGYFQVRTNMFANPCQINRHRAEKVGQKPRPRGVVADTCGPCRPQTVLGRRSIE